MDLQHRLLNRSVSGSILAAVCKSVILDHLVARRAVLIAEFCTLWRHRRFVLDALQIATLPNSSTGLIYCLYSFNSVREFAPHFCPLTNLRSRTLCMAFEALLLQWLVKLKFFPKVTPSIFSSFCSVIHLPNNFRSIFFRAYEKQTNCVFVTFSFIRHLEHHFWISSRALWRRRNVTFLFGYDVHRLISSANLPDGSYCLVWLANLSHRRDRATDSRR